MVDSERFKRYTFIYKLDERGNQSNVTSNTSRSGKILLALCNVVLIASAILFAFFYSTNVQKDQEEMERNNFGTTIESMKQISIRYLDTETAAAKEWVSYIEHEHMTMDEALDYIRVSNTTDRVVHIVDMDTFEARSSKQRSDGDSISVYKTFAESKRDNIKLFVDIMKNMFHDQPAVLGKYKIYESQVNAISVGTRVTLRQDDGNDKDYLFLRVIPVETMKKIWVFPLEYTSAEIGLITENCDYVIPSNSMRSENFIEFIRSYNFADDYNGADAILEQIKSTSDGMFEFKNSKLISCYWYYSKFDNYEGLYILGCIPKKTLYNQQTNWSLVLVTVSILGLLVLIDGIHILGINKRLRDAAQLAKQASDAKTQFLSSMSHDIRTPLNAVLGMTELAKKRPDDPAYVLDCLNKISVSGSHLLTLINDVLEISKVESGKIVLNPAAFSVSELITSLESITQSQANGHGLTFTVTTNNLTQNYLTGDRLRLSQIYLNLLTNAVKYTNPGGNVSLQVSEKPVGLNSIELTCIVSDTGLGMTEEFQKTMYDSFSRATDTRIDKIQGTGLGLAIVKRLVELMDGTITCQSAPGKGTTFAVSIVLPISDPSTIPQPQIDDSTVDSDLTGTRILIAEDNDLNWEIIEAMLEEHGIICTRAENGRICVDTLLNTPPDTYDLVLMDIQMPILNGRAAARELRNCMRPDLRTIPIAAMTADAFAEDIQSCLDAGMNAHLSKPIDIEKALETIRRLKTNHNANKNTTSITNK